MNNPNDPRRSSEHSGQGDQQHGGGSHQGGQHGGDGNQGGQHTQKPGQGAGQQGGQNPSPKPGQSDQKR